MPFKNIFWILFEVSCHLPGLVAGCTIVHKHLRAMNVVKVEHVVLQDLQIEIRIHFLLFERKYRPPFPFSLENHFHAITDCKFLTVGTVYRG